MSNIPSSPWPDSTLALLLDGYEFISKRCRRYDSDLFETRLLLQKVICMQGEAAAQLFYDNDRFQRQGAMPQRVIKTLLGQGGVQGLDGEAHRRRKQMFMSLMTPEGIQDIAALTAEHWCAAIMTWENRDTVVFFEAVNDILCRASCQWAGVPLPESHVQQLTKDLVAMVEAPAALGLRHWQGRLARNRAERWLAQGVDDVRARVCPALETSAAHVMAWQRDQDGELLDRKVIAVELLNIIRPIVAIGRFIVFMALALHEYPRYRQMLQAGSEEELTWFVQEVRRFYPFFPAVAAVVKQEFVWQGYRFPQGRWVLLDLYGTDHDPRLWEQPEAFQPERFRSWKGSAFDFIPQGGGNHHQHHRCAGEWITIELMKVALRTLTQEMEYAVPPQDLRFSLSQVPALPKSRFIIGNVRAKPRASRV